MGNSWGHTLQRLSPQQRETLTDWDSTCRAASTCDEHTTHLGTYNYVTGRAGRVSWRSIYMCAAHADKFRLKHGLDVPAEAQPVPRHALERLVADEPEADYGGAFDGFTVTSDADPGL